MELADEIFKRKAYDEKALIAYGFSQNGGRFTYSAPIADGRFELIINIHGSEIKTDVMELALNEPFVLYHIDNASGAFVGQIRAEAEKILLDVADKCFYADIFKSRQAKMIIDYVQSRYRDKIEFLWEKFPDNAVFRRRDNQKWYGALLTVERVKLGLEGDGRIEIVDLRESPENIDSIVNGKTYLPGYHMNKKHWFSICLDSGVSDEEIMACIDKSYIIARQK